MPLSLSLPLRPHGGRVGRVRPRRHTGRGAIALVAGAVLTITGCGDADSSPSTSGGPGGANAPLAGEITVLAAASLTDAFVEIGEAFEVANPGATVTFSFGPSSGLREQILDGAPADVFASANLSNVEKVIEAGEATGSTVFARNELQIAVPAGNPGQVTGLDDLGDESLLIGLCAPEVPCGELGREALAAAGVTPAPDTEAADVRALLTQITSGDLDAGLVYRTDVLAAGDDVEGIDIPAGNDVVTDYPLTRLDASEAPELADAFATFVLSDSGQEILASYGFAPA